MLRQSLGRWYRQLVSTSDRRRSRSRQIRGCVAAESLEPRQLLAATGAPDLVAVSLSVPSTMSPGIDYPRGTNYTYANQGGNAYRDLFNYRFVIESLDGSYQCENGNLTTPVLAAGRSTSVSLSERLPNDIPNGNYLMRMILDSNNQVSESNENNNSTVAYFRVVNSNVPSPVPNPQPTPTPTPNPAPNGKADLKASLVSGSYTASQGGVINVTTSVENLGDGNTNQTYKVWYYLSSNNTITSSDLLIGESTRLPMPADSIDLWNQSVVIPYDVALGKYYIGIIVDPTDAISESSNLNNSISSIVQTDIQGTNTDLPDLAVTAVWAPATGTPGQPISVSATISNYATVSTGGSSRLEFYLSHDQRLDGSDVVLLKDTRGALLAWGSETVSPSLILPENLQSGDYFLIVGGALGQSGDIRFERNFDNNKLISRPIRISTGVPDVEAQTVIGPTSANAGSSIIVTGNVANFGPTATPSFNAKWVLSTDATIDRFDTVLKSQDRTGLGSGATDSWSDTLTLPAGLVTGDYYIGLLINDGAESNDTAATPVHVNGLIEFQVTTGLSAYDGKADTVTLKVVNQQLQAIVNNRVVQTAPYHLVRSILVVGSSDVDTIDCSKIDKPVVIDGGSGNDVITGGLGNDIIFGGAGNDKITGNGGADALFGDAGNDVLAGSDGDDLLEGGLGNDKLQGQAGADILTGNAGNDTLDGGAGSDRVVETADTDFVATSKALTGLGKDSLIGIETLVLFGGNGNNKLDASSFTGRAILSGLGGNDTLIGTNQADELSGNDGLDVLIGRGGDDSLYGGAGVDSLDGGLGMDTTGDSDPTDLLTAVEQSTPGVISAVFANASRLMAAV